MLLCAALASVNFYLDPFRLAGFGPKADIPRVNEFRHLNTSMWGVADIENVLAQTGEASQVLVLGDSRGVGMTGHFSEPESRAVITSEGEGVFNLGIAGRSVPDSIRVFEAYKSQFSQARTVFLVLPYDKLLGFGGESDALTEALRMRRNRLEYLVSSRTLQYVIEQWASHDFSFPATGAADGFEAYATATEPTPLSEPARLEPGLEQPSLEGHMAALPNGIGRQHRVVRRRILQGRGDGFAAMMNDHIIPFTERNPDIEFIFYLTPYFHALEEHIASSSLRSDLYQGIIRELRMYGDVYDPSMYDGSRSLFVFTDVVHLNDEGPALLQDALRCARTGGDYESIIAYDGQTPCYPMAEAAPE